MLERDSLVRHRAGRGEPLVLLHGIGESAVGWRPVQRALAQEYDVIALDLPGFGDSPPFDDDVLPDAVAFAEAIEHEMNGLGVGQFHVAGYSLGARIALELGSRERVRSVVAIAPDGLGSPLERIYQASALMSGRALAVLLAPLARAVSATGAGRGMFFAMERARPWRLRADDAHHLLLDFARAGGYSRTVLASMIDVPRRLEKITCPVLILQGTADPLLCGQAPRFLAVVPHAQLRWLPTLSHVPISDDPVLVSRLILDFLRTQPSPGERPPTAS
jgi:pimeloyl-ACP methyl ester carboxylesterase